MEPNHNNLGASELPHPQESGNTQTNQEHMAANPEIQGNLPAASPASIPPLQAIPPMPDPAAATPAPLPTIPPMSAGTQQLIADDTDLIEKEWVMKAKAIVAHTKDDPHQQNEAMNKVKADYLKKRYNKDLKINEG